MGEITSAFAKIIKVDMNIYYVTSTANRISANTASAPAHRNRKETHKCLFSRACRLDAFKQILKYFPRRGRVPVGG